MTAVNSKVGGDAFALPIAVARWFRPGWTALFLRQRRGFFSPRFGLGERTFGFRRQLALGLFRIRHIEPRHHAFDIMPT